MSFPYPSEYWQGAWYRRIGSRSLLDLRPLSKLAYEVFPRTPSELEIIRNSVPLVDFVRLQSVTRLGPPLLSLALLGFLAPSAFWLRKATCTGISDPRLRCVFRFSQPLDVFFLPDPSRPCFMPMTLLGFLPPEVSPSVRRDGLSTSLPLLTFTPTRSSPIVCLRRSCSSFVVPTFSRMGARGTVKPFRGFVFRGSCDTKVRSSCPRWLYRRAGVVPLLGFHSLQGVPLSRHGVAFASPPLLSLCLGMTCSP